MPTVARYRIVVVDPVKLRRDRAASEARLRFDVVGVGSEADALALPEGVVHAVVLSLKQMEDNGLVIGKRLRKKFGTAPYFLVHGSAVPAKSAEERALLSAMHRVDLWLPNTLEPQGFEAALWGELERRFRSADQRRAAERPVVAPAEPTWGDLLRQPVTVDNMKRLLTKDLTGGRRGA